MTELIIETDVETPMADGTVLRADVYRPAGSGPLPALVRRTPYRKEGWSAYARALAERGYATVVQDLRGRNRSEGEFVWAFAPEAQQVEAEDGVATIAWTAEQPWCDGSVGTWGHSYDAWSQLRTAAMRPPQLKVMHLAGITGRYLDMTRGILDIGRRMEWCYALGMDLAGRALGDDMPVDRNRELVDRWVNFERGKWLWFTPLTELPAQALTGATKMFQDYLRMTDVELWNFDEILGDIQVPTAVLTGWWDRFSEAATLYSRLVHASSPRLAHEHTLLIGPWSHHPETFRADFGDLSTDGNGGLDYIDELATWFDRHLKGGAAVTAPVRYFTVGTNTWHEEEQWPPSTTERTYHCHSTGTAADLAAADGRLESIGQEGDHPDVYRYDPRDPVMSLMADDAHHAPKDQRANDSRDDVLHYQTPPLDAAVEITGTPRVLLWAVTDREDTDWVVRLIDVAPDGSAVNVSAGILRARYRDRYDAPSLLTPGAVVRYEIAMSPTSVSFQPGHRIRLDITSSDFPNFDRNHNTGGDDASDPTMLVATQTVLHDAEHPTALVLPMVTA